MEKARANNTGIFYYNADNFSNLQLQPSSEWLTINLEVLDILLAFVKLDRILRGNEKYLALRLEEMLNSMCISMPIYPEQQERADKTSFLIGVFTNRNQRSCLAHYKATAQNKKKIARNMNFRKEAG